MNFGTPVPLLVGLILILGAIGLFFLEKLKPGYERSSDKVYAFLLLVSGIFLMAHLDLPLLASFQQVMLVGMLTTLIITDISKRESNRNRVAERDVPPRRYDERPRRVYRAALDDWDAPGQPRIPSNRDRNDNYGGRYEPRPLEPRAPYDDRRPPARLQPGQAGRPDPRLDEYGDGRPQRRPEDRPDPRPDGPSRTNRYADRPYDSPPGGLPGDRQRSSQQPLGPRVSAANGAAHSLGGVAQSSNQPGDNNPAGRPPLNVRPRPSDASTDGNYTDFRVAPPSDRDGDPDNLPQPPVNY